MERIAALKKDSNTHRMDAKTRVAIKAVNTDPDRQAVVRIYEGEISAANYLTELTLPPKNQIGPVYITAQVVVADITSDKVAIGIYSD